MQLFNKRAIKNSFYHTWYLYPILTIIASILWVWGFSAFHLPSNHQTLSIFLETNVQKDSIFYDIMNKKYDREKLRDITISYSLKEQSGYYDKLRVALSTYDIMILTEDTLSGFVNQYENYLVNFDDYIKDNYLDGSHTYYKFNEEDYAVLIKEKQVEIYLNNYMSFYEDDNYYLVFCRGSSNLGKRYDENNAYYDNALTYMNYLIKGEI